MHKAEIRPSKGTVCMIVVSFTLSSLSLLAVLTSYWYIPYKIKLDNGLRIQELQKIQEMSNTIDSMIELNKSFKEQLD
jgi:hypothetical protein